MKVSVIGTGYVGLVSGACLAAQGHRVTCVDIDPHKIAQINQGVPPIHEEGLEQLLKQSIGQDLHATTDLRQAVLDSELTLIAVGTPFDGERIDLSYIETAARQIGSALADKQSYHVVVVKSTVVPGTTDTKVLPILEAASGKPAGVDFGVGMNPEFLREGSAIADFMAPDRIVLGGIDAKTQSRLAMLYEGFENVDVLATNCRTAEMIKYTANSLLATMISFANEIGNLCAVTEDVDVKEVMQGVHLDKRLSPILADGQRIKPGFNNYLEAGCGFGGSCFPKDVQALAAHGQLAGQSMPLLQSVIEINEHQPLQMLKLLEKHFPTLTELRISVLGFAFKPGTDDIRESPTLPVVRKLHKRGARLTGFDPIASDAASLVLDRDTIVFESDLNRALAGADVVMLFTHWPVFDRLAELLAETNTQPLVIDGRRMLDPDKFSRYEGIGR